MTSPARRGPSSKPPNTPSSNGILSIPASATQKGASTTLPSSALHSRASAPRLKVVIRRLAPGLTQDEFEVALGHEWKLGGGKVDWRLFKSGKLSKECVFGFDTTIKAAAADQAYHSPAKPSRPARVYLHLTNHAHLSSLSDKVRLTTFEDAKHSSRDLCLIGPPSVEFAPYGRVPGSRVRQDARQGTIDQDTEFIDFLESLTNPITKPATVSSEADAAGKKDDKVTVTPLIQYLRDKKANKGKEPTPAAKSSKHARQDSKDGKIEPSPEKKILAKAGKDVTPSPEKKGRRESKGDRVAREAVTLLNKRAVNNDQTSPSNSNASSSVPPKDIVSPAPVAEKKRERGNASAAARILQRDLGLGSPGGGRRGARRETSDPLKSNTNSSAPPPRQPAAQPAAKQERRAARSLRTPGPESSPAPAKVNLPPSNAPTGPARSTTPIQDSIPANPPPTGPSASRSSAGPSTPNRTNNTTLAPSLTTPRRASPSSAATQAFLKHANASQGVTEPLLQETFAAFGTVTKVEIDKKKGFAYVDFAEPEGLQNAMRASPVAVAQGNVVVLERKTGVSLQARNVRGGGGTVGRGGGGFVAGPRGARVGGRGRAGVVSGRGSVQSVFGVPPGPAIGPASSPTSAITPAAAPTPGPTPAAAPTPGPTPAAAPTPAPTPAAASTPAAADTSASAPTPAATLAPAPAASTTNME